MQDGSNNAAVLINNCYGNNPAPHHCTLSSLTRWTRAVVHYEA